MRKSDNLTVNSFVDNQVNVACFFRQEENLNIEKLIL
jgi:hypothetical protein